MVQIWGETAWLMLISLRTELFNSVQLYSGESLEMEGSSGVILEFFRLVELYSGDDLKMAGHSVVTLGDLHSHC